MSKLHGFKPKKGKLCWDCNRQLQGFRCAIILGEDGHAHEVHQGCVKGREVVQGPKK